MCQGSLGASVAPRRGKAVMFDSLWPDKSPNRKTWHGGCNVAKVRALLVVLQYMWVSRLCVRRDIPSHDSRLRLLRLLPCAGPKNTPSEIQRAAGEERADLVYGQPTPYHRYVVSPRT